MLRVASLLTCWALISVFAIGFAAAAQKTPAAVGTRAPTFKAHDQFGHEQTIESLAGPNGVVLLFFRSADW
jgi:hypothetical protein